MGLSFEKGEKYSLLGDPDVTVCFLGYDDKHLVFSVLSKKTIRCTQNFAIGRVMTFFKTTDEKKLFLSTNFFTCECKAFEYGQYSTLDAPCSGSISWTRRRVSRALSSQ